MKYLHKFIGFFEILAIVLFIIFEKSVWTFATKTFIFIKSLTVFKLLDAKLAILDKYAILAVFGLIFLASKLMSITSLVLIGSGHFFSGIFVYIMTFPVGALSIWLLEMQKDKLNEFPWFMWTYNKINSLIAALKASKPYARVRELAAEQLAWIEAKKAQALDIKNNRAEYTTKLLKRYKALKRLWRMRTRNLDE